MSPRLLVGLSLFGAIGCREDAIAPVPLEGPVPAHADRAPSGPRIASGYVAIDLGTTSPLVVHAEARSINNNGQVVGLQAGGGNFPFLWDNGTMTPLGGGLLGAYGISDNGLIAGEILSQAALFDGTNVTPLGTLGGVGSQAFAVNDAGQVVGTSSLPSGSCLPGVSCQHPFIWQGGVMTDLGSFGGIVSGKLDAAHAINTAGHAAGQSNVAADGNWSHATFWNGSSLSDLGARGSAYGINDADVVVGETHMNPQATIMHAARWANGTMVTLGTLSGHSSSQARDVNNAGQIVGVSAGSLVGGGGVERAFIWENGVMLELPALFAGTAMDGFSDAAYSINDLGDVVGISRDGFGRGHAVLWRKVQNQAPTAVVGGPYTGAEGASIAFSAAGSSDPNNDPLTYAWDFGDGATGTGLTPAHVYADNGTYTVTVVASDGSLTGSASTTATISNVAPTGVPSAPTTANTGTPFVISIAATDAGSADVPSLQYRFNCGSGWGPVTSTPSTTCTQAAAGTYTLRFSVRDKDLATVLYQRTITVTSANVAPVVTLTSPGTVTVPVGTAVTVTGSFTDAPTDNPWTARMFWGAGQPATNLGSAVPGQVLSATRTFTTPGTFAARLEVRDKFNARGQANVTIVVQ